MCSLRWTTEVLVVEWDEVKLSCSVLFTVCCLHSQGVHTAICSMCHRTSYCCCCYCCCEKDCQRIDGSRVEDSTSVTFSRVHTYRRFEGSAMSSLSRSSSRQALRSKKSWIFCTTDARTSNLGWILGYITTLY